MQYLYYLCQLQFTTHWLFQNTLRFRIRNYTWYSRYYAFSKYYLESIPKLRLFPISLLSVISVRNKWLSGHPDTQKCWRPTSFQTCGCPQLASIADVAQLKRHQRRSASCKCARAVTPHMRIHNPHPTVDGA